MAELVKNRPKWLRFAQPRWTFEPRDYIEFMPVLRTHKGSHRLHRCPICGATRWSVWGHADKHWQSHKDWRLDVMDEMMLAVFTLLSTEEGGRRLQDIGMMARGHGFTEPDELMAIYRLVWVESRFNENAHNDKTNCHGLMQINLDVWGEGPWTVDRLENLEKGLSFLRGLLTQYDGDWKKALAEYVWGPGNLERHMTEHGAGWWGALPGSVMEYVHVIRADSPHVWRWPLWAWWRAE